MPSSLILSTSYPNWGLQDCEEERTSPSLNSNHTGLFATSQDMPPPISTTPTPTWVYRRYSSHLKQELIMCRVLPVSINKVTGTQPCSTSCIVYGYLHTLTELRTWNRNCIAGWAWNTYYMALSENLPISDLEHSSLSYPCTLLLVFVQIWPFLNNFVKKKPLSHSPATSHSLACSLPSPASCFPMLFLMTRHFTFHQCCSLSTLTRKSAPPQQSFCLLHHHNTSWYRVGVIHRRWI